MYLTNHLPANSSKKFAYKAGLLTPATVPVVQGKSENGNTNM